MFESFRRKSDPSPPSEKQASEARMRAIKGSSTAELAARLLIAPTALMQLSLAEATVVVSFMEPCRIQAGTTFIAEGDTADTGYMLLLLDGDVTIESLAVSRKDRRIVTVLGPGSLIGEMSLLDGSARLTSCVASTDLRCAALSRKALEKLTEHDPRTAAKLLLAISIRIAERLREVTDKVRLYSDLVQVMQQEIDHLIPTPNKDDKPAKTRA
ncbi:MAG: cyclic nucleotide-binding domain-containing protein [Polaromonas sp.]|nr:cyclic nucleotide-binding domain-containing protein [Polaromonas sp.]